jgi:hypothetical protein
MLMYFFKINLDVRVSFYVSWLILQAMKLTII